MIRISVTDDINAELPPTWQDALAHQAELFKEAKDREVIEMILKAGRVGYIHKWSVYYPPIETF